MPKSILLYASLIVFTLVYVSYTFITPVPLDELEIGPKRGETVAPMLKGQLQDRSFVELNDLTGEKGLIILFHRSVEWCTYCQKQMIDWNKRADEFEELGYNVVAVVFDGPDEIERFTRLRKIKFDILGDASNDIINAFGILNTDIDRQSKQYGIPHPIVFITDPMGVITDRFSRKGFSKQPSIKTILSSLS